MLGIIWQQQIARRLLASLLIGLLSFGLWGCSDGKGNRPAKSLPSANTLGSVVGKVAEVSPPAVLQDLKQVLESYQPQVKILSPRSNEILKVDRISVRFQVSDFPAFKDATLQLGPHLHVFLDNQPYQAVYDPSQPLNFEGLTPGTHTIRAFASRPWHESFKNEGAYAQVTFHVFAETPDNNPAPQQPLLTYSRPQGNYGAEPIMLDYYLSNVPLHLIAQERPDDDILDWQIRCTVNGESFILDTWEPIYLKGLKPGQNWVQLELLDENGNLFSNPFNNTVRVINYEPGGQDTLSRLVREELTAAEAMGIVDPNYIPERPAPEPTPTPAPTPIEEELPEPIEPAPVPEPLEPRPEPQPIVPVTPPSPAPTITPELESPPALAHELEVPHPEEFPVEIVPEGSEAEPVPNLLPAPAENSNRVKGFFNRFRRRVPEAPVPIPVPVAPEEQELPTDERLPITPELPATEPEIPALPEPIVDEMPETVPTPSPEASKARGFLNRFRQRTPEASTPVPVPSTPAIEELPEDGILPDTLTSPVIEPAIPEIQESPSIEEAEPAPAETPAEPNPVKGFLNRFSRFRQKNQNPPSSIPLPSPIPSLGDEPLGAPDSVPEVLTAPGIELEIPEEELNDSPAFTPELETPERETIPAPAGAEPVETVEKAPDFGNFFNRFKRPTEPVLLPPGEEVPSVPGSDTLSGSTSREEAASTSVEEPSVELEPALPSADDELPPLFKFPGMQNGSPPEVNTSPALKPSPQIPDIGEFLNRFRLPLKKPSSTPLEEVVPLLFSDEEPETLVTPDERLEEPSPSITPEILPDTDSDLKGMTPIEPLRPEPPMPSGQAPSLGQFFNRFQPSTPVPTLTPTSERSPVPGGEEELIPDREPAIPESLDSGERGSEKPLDLITPPPVPSSSPKPSPSFKDFVNQFQNRPTSDGSMPSLEPIPDVLETPIAE